MKKNRLAINGFGRIGRNFLRAAIKDREFGDLVEVVAINDTARPEILAHLFKYDSTFGRLHTGINVSLEDEWLKVNDNTIKMISEKDPALLPWRELQVDVVIESSGKFTGEDARKHIKAGARKVIISAPSKNSDVTILMGINDGIYDSENHGVISMGSCTTNCLAPVTKVIDENFGIESGYITTTHAYTNDQRLLDAPHKDLRRARSAAQSIIPTTTGAARTIGKVIPSLEGKIDGIALRVPVSNGSLIDMVLVLKKKATKVEINKILKESASSPQLKGILGYTEEPVVSSDIIGESYSSLVDGLSTMVIGNKTNQVKILAWYDNEWGFVSRLVDLTKLISKRMNIVALAKP